MSFLIALAQGLAAIPKIADIIDKLIVAFLAYREEKQRQAIEDAIIQLKHSKTQDDRNEFLKKWRDTYK